jgi:hypothetical protein
LFETKCNVNDKNLNKKILFSLQRKIHKLQARLNYQELLQFLKKIEHFVNWFEDRLKKEWKNQFDQNNWWIQNIDLVEHQSEKVLVIQWSEQKLVEK